MTHDLFLRKIGFSRPDRAAADIRRWLYLTVLLAILKVIGMILLVFLGLLVVVCAAVLFIPVRYSVSCICDGSVSLGFTASWCLRVVRLQKGMSEQEVQLSLFGWKIGKKKKRKKTKKKEKDESGPGAPGNLEDSDDLNSTAGHSGKREDTGHQKTGKKKKTHKKSFSFEGISSIISFIRDDDNKQGIQKVKKELFFLFRYLKPSYVRGHVIFGTGDPCTTGWALGMISLIPAAYTEGVRIIPDFSEKELDAEIHAKGKVHLFYFLRMLFRGYMDADMKALISNVFNFV